MIKKFALKIFFAVTCIFLFTGCGDDKAQTGTDPANQPAQQFEILKEPGYYGDLKMQPNGVFLVRNKLAEDRLEGAGTVYKVEFNEDKKPNKITAMNGGTPISAEWTDTLNRKFTFSAVTIEYTDKQTRCNFRNTRMAATPGYYGAYTIGYKNPENGKETSAAYLYDKDGNQSSFGRGYSQMFFTYDGDNLSKIGFADENGNRVVNIFGEYEIRLAYDKKFGAITEVANYGKDGALKAATNGIAKTTSKLDDKGRVIEVKHFGSDDMLKDKSNILLELTKSFSSVSAGAITRYVYEGVTDRVKKISFLGKDEQAEGVKEWGNVSSMEFTYTPQGHIATVSAYATDDSPSPIHKNLFGDNVVKVEFEYDNFGNISKIIFYGKEGNPVAAGKFGASECHFKYDEKRRETGRSYYGTGGDKIEISVNGFNYHEFNVEYNDDDQIVATVYFDKNGNEVRRENSAPTNVAGEMKNNSQSTDVSAAPADVGSFVNMKNQYNDEIAVLAGDINSYLSQNSRFTNADDTHLNRAIKLKERIQSLHNEVAGANIPNANVKSKLLENLSLEIGRVQGLIDGINDSRNGGSYKAGFGRGSEAFKRYETAANELNNLLK